MRSISRVVDVSINTVTKLLGVSEATGYCFNNMGRLGIWKHLLQMLSDFIESTLAYQGKFLHAHHVSPDAPPQHERLIHGVQQDGVWKLQ